jgi:hypothetical protein
LLLSDASLAVSDIVDTLELHPRIVSEAIERLVEEGKAVLDVHEEATVELNKLGKLAASLGPRTLITNIKHFGNLKNLETRLNRLSELKVV